MSGPIWIIDDDEDVREVMKYTLETEGHEVVVFSSALDALDTVRHKELVVPSLIIVDYLMPDMDGVAFINELKATSPEGPGRAPVAICSATDTFEGLNQLPAEVLRLCKPMELDDLLDLVEHHRN